MPQFSIFMIAYGASAGEGRARINTDNQAVSNSAQVLDNATPNPILDIHVSCRDLPKLDVTSESDPMVVMFIPDRSGRDLECARTEVIWNNPNPDFIKIFQAMYIFETEQPLKFGIYDVDSEKNRLEEHDFIGYATISVYQLASNCDREVRLDIINPRSPNKARGSLILVAQQCQASRSVLTGQIKVRKMKKMRTFSRNNPFFILSKPSEAGRSLPVFRSETYMRCYECTWNPFTVPLRTLCNDDMDVPIDIVLMDNHQNHPDVPVGKYTSSVRNLLEQVGQELQAKTFDGKKAAGLIRLMSLNVHVQPTFVDYLTSGLELNLITAIDFTASNGRVTDPKSLHFNCPGQMNQYEMCINEVGRVICQYDRDQMFPVYGFGGKINGRVDHCFPLTFNLQSPCVRGLEGILSVYRHALAQVELNGPTLFTPIIRSATQAALASYNPPSHVYTVLLIMTDGVINDMQETINAIVDASSAPLSIIIVGVGNANFENMNRLDGDDGVLMSSTGARAKRDIVQFVPFNQYASNPQRLAAEVLAEVPAQVDQWCRANGFIPQIPQP